MHRTCLSLLRFAWRSPGSVILPALLASACQAPTPSDAEQVTPASEDTLFALVRSIDFGQVHEAFERTLERPLRLVITTEELAEDGDVLHRSLVRLEIEKGETRLLEREGEDTFAGGLIAGLAPTTEDGFPDPLSLKWLFPSDPPFTDARSSDAYSFALVSSASADGAGRLRSVTISAVPEASDVQLRGAEFSLNDSGWIRSLTIRRSFTAPLFTERTSATVTLALAAGGRSVPDRLTIDTQISTAATDDRRLRMTVDYEQVDGP